MELLKNLEGLSADEQMSAVVELQKAAMKHLEEQKQASIGKSAEMVILGLKKIKSDFEAKFDSLNYDIQTKVANLKDGEQGLQGPKGEQGDRGLDGYQGKDGRDGKDGQDGTDGVDGVGVTDAKIDFDGSLVITLSDGREINVGEVVPVDVAEKIRTVHNIQSGSGGDSQTVLDAIAALQTTIATYGTMATQNANNVAITGGTIDNTTIGATTPSTGVFTTLTGNSTSQFGRSSTNYVQIVGAVTTVAPNISAQGGDTNIPLRLSSKNDATIYGVTNGVVSFDTYAPSGSVNYLRLRGNATGTGAALESFGSDSNVDIILSTKGTGALRTYTNGNQQLAVTNTASAVNYHQLTGSATGSGPIHSVAGSDTNIDLNLTAKGTGSVNLNNGNGIQFKVADTLGSVATANYVKVQGRASGGPPFITVDGTDTNTSLGISCKGAAFLQFYTNSTALEQFRISHTASAVNYVQVTGAATGGTPTISVQGSDTNAGMLYNAKGFGSHTFRGYNGSNTYLTVGTSQASPVNSLQLAASSSGNAVSITALGSDTNIPLVLQPKGTGALQAQQTDSTATGGNARGANAVDWSTGRNAATQVASGIASTVSGGRNNTASGIGSVVAGGGTFAGGVDPNTASGAGSVISGGAQNINSGFLAVIGGGYSNNVSGLGGAVAGGWTNTVVGQFATITGGYTNTANGYYNFIGSGFANSGTSNSAVTTQSGTMNATTAVTLSGSNANIKVGQYITGTSIAGDTYVAAISGTSLTLSKVASGSSTSTLSFYTPHGVVVGGGNNQATGSYSFIGGGGDAGTAANRNVASGAWSVVVGGAKNTASGVASFVGGGGFDGSSFYSNTASGIGSVIVGGVNNTASTNYAFIGNGGTNTASGANTFIGCGYSNTASGTAASISAGNNNTANGANSSIVSGQFGTTRSINSNAVFSSATITTSLGVSQTALVVLGKQTTDATATVITSDGGAAGTTNQVILPNNSAYYFKVEIIANVTGGGNTSGWELKGVIKRGANAASTAIVGSVTSTLIAQDAGASTWVVSATADTTNGGLKITVTGQASTTIRWVAKASTTEVTF